VAIVDGRTGETTAEDSFGYEHTGVVLAFDSLWVANGNGACWAYLCGMGGDKPPRYPRFPNENSLSRLDPTTLRLIFPIRLHAAPESIAANDEAVFVSAYGGRSTVVLRIDPATNEIVRHMPIRSPDPGPLAVIDGAVWMLIRTHGDWMIARVDRRGDRIALPPLAPPVSFSSDGSVLWISSWNGSIIAIDPSTAATVHTIDTAEPIIDVSNGDGGAWAITPHRVLRLDLTSYTVSESVRVARPELRLIDQAGGDVWIASTGGLFRWPQR
jgi:streptogramin lyase